MTTSPLRLQNRTALITGASRGLGAAIAEAFAAEGAQVILLARDVKRLEDLDDRIRAKGGSATLVPFDLSHTDKIAALAPAIAERFGHLDIFVGNAAILGALTPVAQSEAKTWMNVFKINVHANVALLRALDPFLRQSGRGRVLFPTCAIAETPAAYWGPYAASKAALSTLAKAYAEEVAYAQVKVAVIDPGILRTELRLEAFPGEDPTLWPLPTAATSRFVEAAL